ncbi:enoyl-CoA hydratase-related protein [Rhodobacter calidifons]|uniref:2,3-dehydroadipyl-CoA hydratase n=1 Tax=Rhodobacter calidifons TaxID=2715277 RepID=A0ABX0G3C8_9RHOB|nr:enoyl-CoA hydratase-related protein [Rhodobacter calidifons]NHB75619.1 2,3-dehydroadipyl-CoA hydratase [Rhodobacter calidifons]
MDHLLEIDEGAWVRLVLNRPAARNALDTALLGDLAASLERLADRPSCRAVLLQGAGGNFAAGADIAEIETRTAAEAATDPRKAHWAAIRAFPKPMVAAIEGFALGGGLELALMADLMVVGDTARLGLPETNLGLIPGAGGGQRLLSRIGPARAARMVLTGEIMDADTAFAWGIASHRAPDAIAEGAALTARLADRAPLALRAAKVALVAGAEASLAFTEERAGFEALLSSADKQEGIQAFRARRKPEFQDR